MESKNNITTIPLNSGAIFLGTYEDVSQWISAIITVYSDQEVEITAYQSINRQRTITTVFNYDNPETSQTFILSPLTMPFIYFTVLNTSSTNQTYLNFSVKYVSSSLSSAGVSSDVNVTNANIPVTQSGNWSLSVDNFPASQLISGSVDANITTSIALDVSDTAIYDLLNTKGTSLLNNGSILAGANTISLNLSNKKVSNLTFYGTQDSNGNELTVLFSNDGSTFYSSQYKYTFGTSSSGNFGFNIVACPYYVCVKSTNACNLILRCDYC